MRYTQAPLPFQGQKRYHLNAFERVLKQMQPSVCVDVFGGSGLLSHTAKRLFPSAKVVYNDYDGYCSRLANVAKTNALLADLRAILHGYPAKTRISEELKKIIIARLDAEAAAGEIDFMSLSSSLLFSTNFAGSVDRFRQATLYNNVKQSDYVVDGYLDGLELTALDYRDVFAQYGHDKNVLFFVDPPYLTTDASRYTNVSYWKLRDYLDIVELISGVSYVYFTSDRSCIIELCDWLAGCKGVSNPFEGAGKAVVKVNGINGTLVYDDIMLYKQAV